METTKKNSVLREINMNDLWDIFVRRVWVMILVALIVTVGMFTYVKMTFVPRYQSTATLYILNQDSEDSASSAYNNFNLALKVVNDCTYLLKSHTVLDEVIQSLNLRMDYEELYGAISTANPEDTRILEVTVEASTPESAKSIVDAVCSIGPDKIRHAMGFDQVNLYEYGVLNEEPCNTIGLMSYLLVGITAAVLVYAVFLLVYLLDDRIRTAEDVQRYLGLSILGEMPNSEDTSRKGYGYYRYGGTDKKKERRKSATRKERPARAETNAGKTVANAGKETK